MSSLPCLNPNCKSHGQPHPNCRCYGGLAEGGEVSFCSKDRKHNSDCEYYAEGGETLPSFDDPNLKDPNKPQEQTNDSLPSFDDPVLKDASTQFPQASQPLPAFDDPNLKDAKPEMSFEDHAKTAVEAAGRAITFGGTDWLLTEARDLAEKYSDDPDFWAPKVEDVSARKDTTEAKAIEAGTAIASAVTGKGAFGAINNAAKALTPQVSSTLAKIGVGAIRAGIETGLFQGSDEVSNAILGKGDPEAPVASALSHIGAAALFGTLTGGLFTASGVGGTKALQAIQDSKIGNRAGATMIGMGLASRMSELNLNPEQQEQYLELALENSGLKASHVKQGIKAFEKIKDHLGQKMAQTAGATVGGAVGGLPGVIIGEHASDKFFTPIAENIIDKVITKGNKYAFPAVMRALSNGTADSVGPATQYSTAITKGANAMSNAVENLFKVGGQQAIDYETSEKEREKLHKFISEGGLNTQIQNQMNEQNQPDQNYSKGGKVSIPASSISNQGADHIAQIFPEQSMLLGAAKGRIYNYLNSNRPQKPVGMLPYDAHHSDHAQQHSYNRALDIANKPLSVMKHIKDGTLLPEHVKHLANMYPEIYKQLSQKITNKMMENNVEDEKPSYNIRQGLSMFLANPVEKSFTAQNIQAAQAVFKPIQKPGQQQSQPSNGKNKRGTSNLGKINKSYQTADQSAESDRTTRD